MNLLFANQKQTHIEKTHDYHHRERVGGGINW